LHIQEFLSIIEGVMHSISWIPLKDVAFDSRMNKKEGTGRNYNKRHCATIRVVLHKQSTAVDFFCSQCVSVIGLWSLSL
jgi:hypothetical protein